MTRARVRSGFQLSIVAPGGNLELTGPGKEVTAISEETLAAQNANAPTYGCKETI
jgi:hypothetical protein